MKKIIALALIAIFSNSVFASQTEKTSQQNVAKPSKQRNKKVSDDERIRHRVEILKDQLSLNEDQIKKVSEVMKKRNETLKLVRAKAGENQEAFRKEAMPARKQFQADLKSILTPEQFSKLKEIRKSNKRVNPEAKPKVDDDLIDDSELDLRKNN